MSKRLREFTDANGPGDETAGVATGSDTSTRTSRSDEGILSLTNAVLQDLFGLNDETRSRMLKIIRNQGQWFDLKNSIRKMPSVAHRRLNDVINMARKAGTDTEAGQGEAEQGFNPRHEPGEFDHEGHGHNREAGSRFEFEEVKESKTSFAGYLLNELQYTDADLRDPQKKQDIMRMMRAGDSQAEQLVTRGNREQKQEQRQQIQQEKDPQRVTLLRKKQMLQKQINVINQQLGEPGADEEQA